MNNSVVQHAKTLYSHRIYTSINPLYHKIPSGESNNPSMKRKYKLPLTNREFGREIILTNNLTVYNNQEVAKTKKNFDLKYLNIKNNKGTHYNQIKNYERSIKEINHRNQNRFVRFKLNENNKENNANLINSKHFKHKSMLIDKDNESKGNSSKHNINNNEEDVEMKDVKLNKKSSKHFIIYNNKFPQNVDEYFNDICIELNNKEEKYFPDSNYMSKQKDINHRMRAILIDWLVDVHLKYKMVPQTLYIAVNLIDRYLSINEASRIKLQLVGVASMFIASKYEEIYPPELKDFVYITDNAYVKSEVLHMESKMLSSLNFDITFPTQWSFLEIFRKKLDLDQKTFYLAWFLMELSLINYKMLKYKMSQIAASALFIAIKSINFYNKTNFEKSTGYTEDSIQDCVREINNYNIYNSTHSLQAIRRKFSSKKYEEVAKIQLY